MRDVSECFAVPLVPVQQGSTAHERVDVFCVICVGWGMLVCVLRVRAGRVGYGVCGVHGMDLL